jgi:hypothetical protein
MHSMSERLSLRARCPLWLGCLARLSACAHPTMATLSGRSTSEFSASSAWEVSTRFGLISRGEGSPALFALAERVRGLERSAPK